MKLPRLLAAALFGLILCAGLGMPIVLAGEGDDDGVGGGGGCPARIRVPALDEHG